MKILFVSRDLIAGDLAYVLKKEGHEVKLYIDEKGRKGNFGNLVQRTTNWKNEIEWVGKEGLIIFDDVGWGQQQEVLRKKGYQVVGGSKYGDKIEMDREFGQAIFEQYGMKTFPLYDFKDLDDAVVFAQQNRRKWVIKRNDGMSKFVSYVGHFEDGRDVISLLKVYLLNKDIRKHKITLHERVEGIEIGVGRYFNGHEWVGPIEFNVEHTQFMPGDIGPTTSEMGTLAWYDADESNKLYQDTLAKIEPYLKEINFKGDFGINCIVNETGTYILEATSRFGSPIIHLQTEIHESPWGEFLLAIAKGEKYDLKWKKGYGIVVVVAVPPFPYAKKMKDSVFYGMNIYFDNISNEDFRRIKFEEVSARCKDCAYGDENFQLYISDERGYVAYTTGLGETVEAAQKQAYTLAEKIIIPKKIYRNDIGSSFINGGQQKLKQWGYLK